VRGIHSTFFLLFLSLRNYIRSTRITDILERMVTLDGSDVKNMEIGGAIKSVTKGEDNWWNIEHAVTGKGKMKFKRVYEYGILDHEFIGAGLNWKIYVRVVPNEEGSAFLVRPQKICK
ncbi:MAG TPA: hypothetical protein VE548_08390, partial [Nitrososphaeraceae archaeon]|nr:hypothetical protein [Nitrososphaeraceae archaeon]